MKKLLLVSLLASVIAGTDVKAEEMPMMNMSMQMMMPNYFMIKLDGMSEKPDMVKTDAMGEGMAVLMGNMLWISGKFMGLSGSATAAHIHGPADMNTSAGVVVHLAVTPDKMGVFGGQFMLNEMQMMQLMDGMMYVNIHTKDHPAGEIRGQLMTTMQMMHQMGKK